MTSDHPFSETDTDKQACGFGATALLQAATNGMSEREDEILCLLARGLTMNNVSRLLNISVRAVAYRKYRFMDRHDLKTTAQLAAFVKSMGVRRQ